MKGETAVQITCYRDNKLISRDDNVAVEEPLEVYLCGAPFYMTMRSPGLEKELALGLCFSEGIIDSLKDVEIVEYCGAEAGNRVDVLLDPRRKAAKNPIVKERRSPAYSSCGICGKELVADIHTKVPVRAADFVAPASRIKEIVGVLNESQEVFERTGGTHAVGIFDKNWQLLAFAEDIGRHNALDKAVGKIIIADKLNDAMIIGLTSRMSYEMIIKASRTPAQILVGISAPTSLGIDLARKVNLTVVGFVKQDRFNIYSATERIVY